LSGRGLCDELITRAEESYRLCCVVVCDLETSRMGAPYIYDISHLRVKENVQVLQSTLFFAATSIITLFTDRKWHSEYTIYGEGARSYREVHTFKISHM